MEMNELIKLLDLGEEYTQTSISIDDARKQLAQLEEKMKIIKDTVDRNKTTILLERKSKLGKEISVLEWQIKDILKCYCEKVNIYSTGYIFGPFVMTRDFYENDSIKYSNDGTSIKQIIEKLINLYTDYEILSSILRDICKIYGHDYINTNDGNSVCQRCGFLQDIEKSEFYFPPNKPQLFLEKNGNYLLPIPKVDIKEENVLAKNELGLLSLKEEKQKGVVPVRRKRRYITGW